MSEGDFSQSEKLQDEVVTFAVFKKFFNSINETMMQIAVFISILIGLFYFRIPANWLMALKIALFLVAFNIFSTILEFPLWMNWYDTEDTIASHITNNMINTIMNSSLIGFLIMVVITGFDKLYRKTFPHFISVQNLLNGKNLTNQTWFNSYVIGMVAGTCFLALSSIFYY